MATNELSLIRALDADPTLKRATLYTNYDFVIKLTRQRKYYARARTNTFLLTYGDPNFSERAFIEACKKKGVPLPKHPVVKPWPVPRGPRKKKGAKK